ncbi:MAG: DUF2220 family protein [Desulfobacteraceae bacterium]|jgi:hypothetical protein
MHSPEELSTRLARQWRNADIRERRLLSSTDWPIQLPIGRPGARKVEHQLDQVRVHVQAWRKIKIGAVLWEEVKYRHTAKAVSIPRFWQLHKPSEWIEATFDSTIKKEFQKLARIVTAADPAFHSLLVRQRHLVLETPIEEVVQACELALLLERNCARGIPLRALSLANIDSKFFERNRSLMIKLLDIRFNGLVSELGLEAFLGAINENDHWLLVVDLDGNLLPFEQQRVRDRELIQTALPGDRIIIVENERCRYQLPKLAKTIAILGAGLNLSWMIAPWLSSKAIAYWGDIDTWGLAMLAQARCHQPLLTVLLMTKEIYNRYGNKYAVIESKNAGDVAPKELTISEKRLYRQLITENKGRLEQEFLPKELVQKSILAWGKD